MHPVLHAFLAQTADGAAQPQSQGLGTLLIYVAAPLLIFYFLVIRPQSKERRKLQDWVSAVKKGDEVVTQGGIIGTVTLVDDRTVFVDVGSGTKLRVLKSQIAGPWKQVESQPAKAEAKK